MQSKLQNGKDSEDALKKTGDTKGTLHPKMGTISEEWNLTTILNHMQK